MILYRSHGISLPHPCQVGGLNSGPRYAASPQQHPNHFSRASSYGSAGSYGSFGEGAAMDGNFESYVDDSGAHAMAMNGQASTVGSSPESIWQGRPFVPSLHPQHPVFNQMRALNLGASPSLNLGASPSQFGNQGLYQLSPVPYGASPGGSFPSSPASSFFQSNGSQQGSPNRYGPASPARLLETAVVNATAAAQHGHFHRRRPWQPPPPLSGHGQQQPPPPPPQDLVHWSRLQHGNANGNVDASSNIAPDGQSGFRRGAPPVPHSRSGRTGSGTGVSQVPRPSASYAPGTLGAYLSPGSSVDAGDEDSAIDPHWDPDFPDEVLQEDAHDVGPLSRRTSVGRLSNCSSLDGTSPASSHSSASSYRPKPGHFSSAQTSPSRLGPQAPQVAQQQRQLGNHHQQPQNLRQQVSPEQTPLHSYHGPRRQMPVEMGSAVPGTGAFQQRQQFQFQQQQLQNSYHQQHHGMIQPHPDAQFTGFIPGNPKSDTRTHESLLPSPQKDNRLPQMGSIYSSNTMANANSPSATGFAMTAGIGHPLHAAQHQRFYGGEDLHHQFAGGFLPQNQYFANDLYLSGDQFEPFS